MTHTHANVKVKGYSVQKLDVETDRQTDRRTDGRMDGGDCITCRASAIAVSNYSGCRIFYV